MTEVIAGNDLRHRLSYTALDLDERVSSGYFVATNLDVVLLLGLGGKAKLMVQGMSTPLPIPAGSLAAIGPPMSYQVTGPGRLGRLLLTTELNYEARRAGRPAPSPEYSPGVAMAGREGQGIKVDRGEPGPA